MRLPRLRSFSLSFSFSFSFRMLPLILAGAVLTTSVGASCGVPAAERIEGDIAAVLQRGIDSGAESFDHQTWDEILMAHVKEGGSRFDYAGLKSEEVKLTSYLDSLAAAPLGTLAAAEIEALFINAYNAYTVRTILDHVGADGTYEIESIMDIPDVFKREAHEVGGFTLSLDNIEHNILRPLFRDPRIHFAVNCASISCPPLPGRAFRAETLDAQLESATESALRDPSYVTFEGDGLLLTKILEWYGSDFVDASYRGAKTNLASFIEPYATEDVAELIRDKGAENVALGFRDYDWGLNRY